MLVTTRGKYICSACGRYGKTRELVTDIPCTGMAKVVNVYAWAQLRGDPAPVVVEGRNIDHYKQSCELLRYRRAGDE